MMQLARAMNFSLVLLFWKILLDVSSLPFDDEHEIIVNNSSISSISAGRRRMLVPQQVAEGQQLVRGISARSTTGSTSTDYYYEEGESPVIEDDILGGTTPASPTKHLSDLSSSSSYRGRGSNMDTISVSSSNEYSGAGSSTTTSSSTTSTSKHPYKLTDELESDYYTSTKKSHSNKGGFFRGSSSHFRWKHFHFRPIHYIFGSFFTVLFFFGGATFVTAYQVLEQPSGCYATTCRRAIVCYKCILSLFTKGITYFLWGQNERWEGFESCDTDFEEEENLPRLRAGIGRALEREHSRSMNIQQQSMVKSTITPYNSRQKNTTNYTTRTRGIVEMSTNNS